MARHTLVGDSPLFLASLRGSITDRLLYATATEFGIQNSDGSRSYFHGTGLVWSPDVFAFTAGAVTSVSHYDADGGPIESLAGANISAINVTSGIVNGFSPESLFAAADSIDARFRAGDAVIDDTLRGYAGNDFIAGGSGADRLDGGAGADRLLGGTGNDALRGGTISQDQGSDRLYGEEGHDVLYGGRGNDLIDGGANTDTAVFSGLFADLAITRNAAGFMVKSLDGRDQLAGIEQIAADDGVFRFDAAAGAWTKTSNKAGAGLLAPETVQMLSNARDVLMIEDFEKDIVIYARGGDDFVNFTAFGTSLFGAGADAIVFGGTGNDVLAFYTQIKPGGARLYGEDGNDGLRGGFYDDVLNGGAGNDELLGWTGNDIFTGGSGADLFYFNTAVSGGQPQGWGNQVITDFELRIDHIDLGEGSTYGTPELTQTADGLLFAYHYDNPTPGAEEATILFRGLHMPGMTLADLIG